MKGVMVMLALCAALLSCAAERGFLRPRVAPQGVEARNACASLRQLSSINPIYPREAMPVKQDGWVLLQYDVSAGGVPINVTVLDSSPQGVFDQASLNAISKWRYVRKGFATADCVHLDSYSMK